MVGLLVLSSYIGTRIGSGTDLVGSPLWHHDDAPDFLHLGVVGRADSIQVACNLQGRAKVSLMVGSQFMYTNILIEPYMYTDPLASSTQTHNLPSR